MSRSMKVLLASVLLAMLAGCAVVPAPYPYYGARVDVMTVRPAPVYRGGGGYYGHSDGHRRHHHHHHERW